MNYQRTTEMNNREMKNNERNPFQRNNRSNNYARSNGSNGSSGYASWKNKTNPQGAPAPPKEKVLTADDFPALPTATASTKHIPDKNAWGSSNSDTTLADRVKDVIAKEEEARARGYREEEREETVEVLSLSGKGRQQVKVRLEKEDKVDVMPLSDWMKSKQMAKNREEQMKRLEDEEYEANYRWQISPQMIPPKPEPEMPEYNEDDLEEEELEETVDDQGPVERSRKDW